MKNGHSYSSEVCIPETEQLVVQSELFHACGPVLGVLLPCPTSLIYSCSSYKTFLKAPR